MIRQTIASADGDPEVRNVLWWNVGSHITPRGTTLSSTLGGHQTILANADGEEGTASIRTNNRID